jgi:hypothetical protein
MASQAKSFRKEDVKLKVAARLALFLSSYSPLFVLIIFKQIYQNWKYLSFGGFTSESFYVFLMNFGLSTVLVLALLFGFLGFKMTFKNLKNKAENGKVVEVEEISNKNSEAIGYIATYILPFLYDGFNDVFSGISVLFLLIVIYSVYTRSSMLVINPVISFFYCIYDIKYKDGDNRTKSGLIVIPDDNLEEGDKIKINRIGYKIYYSINYE